MNINVTSTSKILPLQTTLSAFALINFGVGHRSFEEQMRCAFFAAFTIIAMVKDQTSSRLTDAQLLTFIL